MYILERVSFKKETSAGWRSEDRAIDILSG
jgi:hypothetical protein